MIWSFEACIVLQYLVIIFLNFFFLPIIFYKYMYVFTFPRRARRRSWNVKPISLFRVRGKKGNLFRYLGDVENLLLCRHGICHGCIDIICVKKYSLLVKWSFHVLPYHGLPILEHFALSNPNFNDFTQGNSTLGNFILVNLTLGNPREIYA